MENAGTLEQLQVRWSKIEKGSSSNIQKQFPMSWSDKQFLSSIENRREIIRGRGFGKSFLANPYPGLTQEKVDKVIEKVKKKPIVFNNEAAQFEGRVHCGKGIFHLIKEMEEKGELVKYPPEPISNRDFKLWVGASMYNTLKKEYPFLINNE